MNAINTKMTKEIRYFIVTGEPGVGKTTLIKKLNKSLNESGITTGGFITEEVRENKVRQGFDVVTLSGARGKLARDQRYIPSPTKYTVGKYCVLLSEFEKLALPSLTVINNGCLVIDEIGKMELFSSLFKNKIKELFDDRMHNFILATIPLRKSDGVIEHITRNRRAKIWTVTRENRNNLHEEILRHILDAIISH